MAADFAQVDPSVAPTRIVLVDDDEAMQLIVRLHLELHGFDIVAEATEGEEGLELTIGLRPGAVVLDWNLHGGIDGPATLAHLRHRVGHVPVVVFTSDRSAVDLAVALGASAVVRKGGPVTELRDILIHLTDTKRSDHRRSTTEADPGYPLTEVRYRRGH